MNRIEVYKRNALIKEINPLQIKLSEEFISPNLNHLHNFCEDFRAKLDFEIDRKIDSELTKPFTIFYNTVINNYPIDLCREITRSFLIYYAKNKPNYLIEFEQNGGVVKQIWGNLENKIFQNSIQIGDYFVDVANDSVDKTELKINIDKLKNIAFNNIETVEEFIKIKTIYHNVNIYKNNVVPEIYEYYPLIQVSNNGISFVDNVCLAFLLKEKKETIPTNISNLPTKYWDEILAFFKNNNVKFDVLKSNETTLHNLITFFNSSKGKVKHLI